jgi:hypothetical protein
MNRQVANEFSELATMKVNSEINKMDQDFKQIESITKGLSAQIALEVDVNKAKSDIGYLRDYTDDIALQLSAIGEKTQVTNSLFVYFNVDMFGDAADAWVFGDQFERQSMIEKEYYDVPREWYDTPVREGVTRWTFP